MLYLFCWLLYGLIVGFIAKKLHPGEDPVGFLPTILIGISGSYMGGFLNWLLGWGGIPLQSSGLIFGILGGIICCMIYRQIKISQFIKIQGRSPRMFVPKNEQK